MPTRKGLYRRSPVDFQETRTQDGLHLRVVSQDLRNTRDLRSLLLETAYELQGRTDMAEAHIILERCQLARGGVEAEFEQFLGIAARAIRSRIQLHLNPSSVQTPGLQSLEQPSRPVSYSATPKSANQEAVIAYLLHRYLNGLPGLDVKTIAAHTQSSIPTVYKALHSFAHCITKNMEDKTLRLSSFSTTDWLRWMERSNRLSSVYFIDVSGIPRSSARLGKELKRLQRDDLAIGGLMGALHHLPGLDATVAPQLDILLHGTVRSDLSFIQEIDPGLELHRGRPELASVVVHFVDHPQSLFVQSGGQNWGSLPDCIANMHKAKLTHQVGDAVQIVTRNVAALADV